MRSPLMLAVLSFVSSIGAFLIGAARGYRWPPPHEVSLLAFPEAILCALALCTAIAATIRARRQRSALFIHILCYGLVLVAVAACGLVGSLRFNYEAVTERQSERIQAQLEKFVRERQSSLPMPAP